MKVLKTSIITILLLVITLYLPTIVKATNDTNDIILNERKLYSNSIDNSNSFFALGQTVISHRFKRSITIPITRSSLSDGINMEITPNGHYVLVALFKRGSTTEIIGSSFTAPEGIMTAHRWVPAELGNNREIDVFISATADVTVSAYGAITY